MRAAFDEKELIAGEYVDEADYSRYKYVLNLPGSTTGSYSRNLNHLWALGAVVFLWEAPFVEWSLSTQRSRPPASQGLRWRSTGLPTATRLAGSIPRSSTA